MFLWLLLQLSAASAKAVETCQNYPTTIRPNMFREGDWMDQVRVYSGSHDYVSQFHPSDTVSMFLAKHNTNCGYFELKVLNTNAFELHKGYYVARFKEHFYPSRFEIERNYSSLKCSISLEKRHCEFYVGLTKAAERINILLTDYSSFMVIHQCVDGKNYMMMLTKKQRLFIREKVGIENTLIDVMKEHNINIDNRTFWWPTTDNCDKLVGRIFPIFYQKIYIDRNQTDCPENLPFKLINLKDFWKDKVAHAEKMWVLHKTIIICVVVMVCGTFAIVGSVAIFLDNYKM